MNIHEKLRERRCFSPYQKTLLFELADGLCQMCYWSLGDDWEADHIIRYVDGGTTTLSNGQALCRDCHKQKTMYENFVDRALRVTNTGKTPRKWQAEALRAIESVRLKNPSQKHFCIDATPGAGKSLFLQLTARYFLEAGLVDSVMLLVPTDKLRTDAKDGFMKEVGLELIASSGQELTNDLLKLQRKLNQKQSVKTIGQALTYSQTTNTEVFNQALSDWSADKRMLLIADEVHHAAEGNNSSWGKALNVALDTCEYAVLLTGTLFRSDMQKIPGVQYLAQKDQTLLADPHYKLTLKQATEDNYVSTVNFTLRDCELKFSVNSINEEGQTVTEILTRTLSELNGDAKETDQLYTLTLDPNQPSVRLMFAEAIRNLEYKRARFAEKYGEGTKQVPAPGGLVVCKDRAMADATAAVIAQLTGDIPAVVHGSAGKNMKQRIADFKDSNKAWCVSVGMISEGVDIPRIKTLVYLTNKKTDLVFAQIVGRAQRVRYDANGEAIEEMATVLMPYHPYLEELAKDFMNQQGVLAFENPEEAELQKPRSKDKSVDEQLAEILQDIEELNKKTVQVKWRELIESKGGKAFNYLNGERTADEEFIHILLDLGVPLERAQEAHIEASKRGLLTI